MHHLAKSITKQGPPTAASRTRTKTCRLDQAVQECTIFCFGNSIHLQDDGSAPIPQAGARRVSKIRSR